MPSLFIGLDMVDGCRPSPRKVDLAFLDRSLVCAFEQWDFDSSGKGLVPGQLGPPGFLLAIDGPQGLAASPGQKMRECEREGGLPGKSSYDFPPPNMPYAGFVASSVRLFAALWWSRTFRLHGFQAESTHQATLIEVYPGKAWVDLARPIHMPLTEKKDRLEGRRQRQRLLEASGVRLPSGGLPTHDQLDAALAALIAVLFAEGKTTQQGAPPFWDDSKQVLREGFIIYP
jgi:predicted nuclease with RNAse H fold